MNSITHDSAYCSFFFHSSPHKTLQHTAPCCTKHCNTLHRAATHTSLSSLSLVYRYILQQTAAQHPVMHFNKLQRARPSRLFCSCAVCGTPQYSTLQHPSPYCNTLQHILYVFSASGQSAAHYNTTNCKTQPCNTLRHHIRLSLVFRSRVLYKHCNVMQHPAPQPRTLQHAVRESVYPAPAPLSSSLTPPPSAFLCPFSARTKLYHSKLNGSHTPTRCRRDSGIDLFVWVKMVARCESHDVTRVTR